VKKEKRALIYYLVFVFAISAVFEAMWIRLGAAGEGIAPVLMWVPAVVAVVLKLVFFRKEKLLGFCPGKPVFYLFAVLIPLAYIGISYLLYWQFAPGAFAGLGALASALAGGRSSQYIILDMVVTLIVTIVMSSAVALGEELGWRGLMFPTMYKLWGRNSALLVSGLIWAAWHLPLLISGNYMPGAVLGYSVPMFIVQFLAITVIASWLRVKSGSVLPAALWHGMHNVLDQTVFTSMTTGVDKAYFVSETGAITTVCAVIIAILILVFGKFNSVSGDV